jgi:tetratricopeptide (TPR) repeat protein
VKTLLCILALLCWPFFGHSQFKQDSIKIHSLLSKGGQAARTAQYDSSRYYYREAERLSREIDYQHGIMSSTLGHGLVHHYEHETDEALQYYLEALEMLDSDIDPTHPDIELLYNNLGGVYIDLGYRLKAREYLMKALALKETNSSPVSTAITHYNLGLIYLYFGENESALHHFMAAYPAYLEHYGENGARVAQLYTNIGAIHEKLGNIEQATEYFQRGIAIHMENHGPDYWNLAYPYTNLGSLYAKTGRSEMALEYYLKSLELCRNNRKELTRLEALTEGALAQYYLEQGKHELSRAHAEQAVAIMQEAYYAEHPRISEFYTIIGQSYVKQKNYELASQWFDQARDLTVKGFVVLPAFALALFFEDLLDVDAVQELAQLLDRGRRTPPDADAPLSNCQF